MGVLTSSASDWPLDRAGSNNIVFVAGAIAMLFLFSITLLPSPTVFLTTLVLLSPIPGLPLSLSLSLCVAWRPIVTILWLHPPPCVRMPQEPTSSKHLVGTLVVEGIGVLYLHVHKC